MLNFLFIQQQKSFNLIQVIFFVYNRKKNWSIFRRSYQIDAKNSFTEYLNTKTQRPKLKCCYRNFHIRYSLYNLVQSGVTFISKSKYCHHTMNYGLKISTWILLLLLNSSASLRYRVALSFVPVVSLRITIFGLG